MSQIAPPTEDSGATPGVIPPRPRLRLLASVRSGVIAAALFVLGLIAGALVVALIAEDPVVVRATDGGTVDGGVPGPLVPDEDASVGFVVDGTCLRAVNAAQDTFLVVEGLGEAAAELDAARLDEIVRRLMPLQRRLESGLDGCEVSTVVGGTDQTPAVPSAPPSAAPTGSAPTD